MIHSRHKLNTWLALFALSCSLVFADNAGPQNNENAITSQTRPNNDPAISGNPLSLTEQSPALADGSDNASNNIDIDPTVEEPGIEGADIEGSIDSIDTNNNQKALMSYRAAIKELDENGPYHEQSSEALYGLAMELKKQGFYDEALNTFQRAMHINRVNHGLHSFSQVPMLRGIIDSQKALNLFEDVTTDYNRMLSLFLKNHGASDPALIPVFRELALWHVDIYQVDKSSARVDHLTSAHRMISAAINSASHSHDLDTEAKIDLLRTVALVNFYFSTHEGDEWASSIESRYSASADKDFLQPARMGTLSRTGFRQGKVAHEQIIALVEADPNTTMDQKISAYVETGDWHLLFNRRDSAMQYYQQAMALIAHQTDGQQELTNTWFSKPKFLPVLRTEDAANSSGILYVTAKLDISKTGNPSHISIVEPPPEGNRILRRAAMGTIRGTRFRPRFVDGHAVASPGSLIRIPLIH